MLAKSYSEAWQHPGLRLVVCIVLVVFFCSVEMSVATDISFGSKTDAPDVVIYGQLQDEIGIPLQLNPAASGQSAPDIAKVDIDDDLRDMTLEELITALERKVHRDLYESLKVSGSSPD